MHHTVRRLAIIVVIRCGVRLHIDVLLPRWVVILSEPLLVTDRDLLRTAIFFRDAIIRWIQYRNAIRNEHYFNVCMYRIFEYYDVYVSYFRLSYDIIFHIYDKNDIFEPKQNIIITLIYDHRTYTSDASNENKYFSRRSIHLILSGRDQIAKSNR